MAVDVNVSTRVVERIEVTGVVQGVGFRPFVYRLARELGLDGTVGNDPARVFIEVAGPPGAVDELVRRLRTEAPPLARVDTVARRPLGDGGDVGPGFHIVDSRDSGVPATLVPPDTAVCDDCLAELFDPADRRYRHPFITCTNCGPRFTIITGLPYDRPATTMAAFPLCPQCSAEYHDPGDRRYHAQPIACPSCGPTLRFAAAGPDSPTDPAGVSSAGAEGPVGEAALQAARDALRAGRIVAVKGLGGYHLACDATSEAAVTRLRQRKHRPDKPFAVMVADGAAAHNLAHLTPEAARALLGPARPVVLAPARAGSGLAAAVAPGNPLVGVMAAYTPVHHLLLEGDVPPLVMTSANLGGEPIIHGDDEASRARLDLLCDAVLTHDRPIAVPCDDSVVRVDGRRLLPVRRARGFAPVPVALDRAGHPTVDGPEPRPVVLAVGGELKNTFCVAAGGQAWISQHLGDLENYATLVAFESSVERLCAFYGTAPSVVAVDAHPGYATHSWARRRFGSAAAGPGAGPGAPGVEIVEVQHHHAHVAAVLAEHGWAPDRPVLGFAFDGTGFGTDGAVWGGEALVATAAGFDRVAHLVPVPLPGGDAAVRNPCRVALAHLWAAGIAWTDDLAPVAAVDDRERGLLARQLERGVACVPTTSMGRLFDAVASLAGLRHHISFEAQAAIDLELAALDWWDRNGAGSGPAYRFGFDGRHLDPGPVLASIVADLRAGTPVGAVALAFHRAVADAVVEIATAVRARAGNAPAAGAGSAAVPAGAGSPVDPAGPLSTVVLSGGVFQNLLALGLCRDALTRAGFTVLTHELVPPNDGGLSLGQAWIATHRPSSHRQTAHQHPIHQPQEA